MPDQGQPPLSAFTDGIKMVPRSSGHYEVISSRGTSGYFSNQWEAPRPVLAEFILYKVHRKVYNLDNVLVKQAELILYELTSRAVF